MLALTLFGLLLSLSATESRAAERTWHTQISTGRMLGAGYDPHWFYVRQNGGEWEPTYAGSNLEGRLMNFRAANALFDDEHRTDDDPEANTAAFIANFDVYKEHGILAMTISLQGGNPGYERALVSAFTPDGSLKAAWMDRASQVIEAADERGMVIILSYFYQRQDQVLIGEQALKQGIINATDWLIANDYRNVIIEIANEYPLVGFNHPIIGTNTVEGGIGELINLAKSRFDGKDWRLPVTAARDGIQYKDGIAQTADLAIVHGNQYKDWEGILDTYEGMKRIYDNHDVPVVMSEDDNGATPDATTLARDTHAMDDAIRAGGSWGLMWKRYNQYFPFHWQLGDASQLTTEEDYFHAILDVVQQRVGWTHTDPTPVDTTPAVPTGLTASFNDAGTAITLDWYDNGESDLAGYWIYRSASQTGPFTEITSTLVTTSAYIDTSAPVGTSYYQVTAEDMSGNESGPSNTVEATPAPITPLFSLVVSTSSNRAISVPLEGQKVSGKIYVFTTPDVPGISQVRLWLDNPTASGEPKMTENNAPYDFAGGTVAEANPFNTATLADGSHTITTAIDHTDGTTTTVHATFTVNNEVQPRARIALPGTFQSIWPVGTMY